LLSPFFCSLLSNPVFFNIYSLLCAVCNFLPALCFTQLVVLLLCSSRISSRASLSRLWS
jgi:hypothetical protein